jgi:hypothetical protein
MNSPNGEAKNMSNEIMVKLFLDNLIEKYSLKEIIDCIISETTLCYNNKHKKELVDIVSLICKNTSIDNLFKYILEFEDQKNIDKEESQKRISLSTDEEEFGHQNQNQKVNNIINISDDDMDNENIINLTDSDDNMKENENKDLKIIKNRDYSFSKNYNLNDKNKSKDLSYHYSIINGECYKYKLKGINEDGIATFICFDKNCESYGIYNLTNKMFTILKEHNYSCNKNLNSDDKINFSYMKNINIEEMQIVND